ncbi:SIR2 family protein [Xanthomonas translucens]|uniref:SIR2 family protein n=1 Tax=Xanthomonas campestris pv. translucens TaxID=343 RepID=UPI00071E84B0|nr:SIR2 family protein [Xanthomonas translucens]
MARKTLVFGNGLGMALDPNFFSLDNAIGRTWEDNAALDDRTKDLVRYCLGDGGDRPHGEDDLDDLQLVVSACDFLSRTGSGEVHWLSDHGKLFPEAVRKFLYQTSLCFHQRDFGLPMDFVGPLVAYLHKTNSHVATLNYDNLLYQPMIESHILNGYEGALVDGFWGTGFAEENLERKFGRNFGYYMHLHGSPLFVDREGRVIKLRQANVGSDDDTTGSHIVLTHVKHKETVIAASPLLACYWGKFAKALAESESAVLVGYSGCDKHLNSLLRSRGPSAIRVVEWEGAGQEKNRQLFWNDLLGRQIQLVRLNNILSFTDW